MVVAERGGVMECPECKAEFSCLRLTGPDRLADDADRRRAHRQSFGHLPGRQRRATEEIKADPHVRCLICWHFWRIDYDEWRAALLFEALLRIR